MDLTNTYKIDYSACITLEELKQCYISRCSECKHESDIFANPKVYDHSLILKRNAIIVWITAHIIALKDRYREIRKEDSGGQLKALMLRQEIEHMQRTLHIYRETYIALKF